MPRRITIASQKGGVGKTTVVLNLAVALAERGHPTLIVDLDPQGSQALALGRGDTELPGLAELLMKQATPEEAVLKTRLPGLSILPRGRLDAVDAPEFERALFSPGVLEEALQATEAAAEYVIVDTPSGVGMATRAALVLSDYVLIPFQTESLGLRSLGQALRVIEHVTQFENPRLRLLGLLPTMVDKSFRPTLSVLSDVWNGFPVLDTMIPRAEIYATASEKGLPVSYQAGRSSPEARRFDLLAGEIEGLVNRFEGKEAESATESPRELL